MFPINQKSINKLTALGMMTALVFVSNYLRITMPIAIGGRTSFTLANIMCCLSGLLLGPVGGLASGLGSALYDLTNPAFALVKVDALEAAAEHVSLAGQHECQKRQQEKDG